MSNPSTLARSRSRSALGAHGSFTVVCVKEWKGAFGGWGENDTTMSSEPGKLVGAPRIKPKNLGSMNELSVRKGDIIKVSSACNREGRNRRPIPRVARRLDSGFLDTKYPVHDPDDDTTWWVGTIVRNGRDTRTGRFPQSVVALTAELRQKTQTFRCKMCSRMQKNFTKSPVLEDFGITGQVGHVFGARDLCDTCGPKILRVVKNVAVNVLAKAEEDDKAILAALRALARRKLVHESAQESFTLSPRRTSAAAQTETASFTEFRRPNGAAPGVASPRTRRVTTPPGGDDSVALDQSGFNQSGFNFNSAEPQVNFGFGSSSTTSNNGFGTPAPTYELLPDVMAYCRTREYLGLFEEFILNHLKYFQDAELDESGNPEHTHQWSDIFQEYLRVFVNSLQTFIERKGKTVEDFYAECKIANEVGENQQKHFIKLLLASADYEEFVKIMVRESSFYGATGTSSFGRLPDEIDPCNCSVCNANASKEDLAALEKNVAQIFEDSIAFDGHMKAGDIVVMTSRLQQEYPNVMVQDCTLETAEFIVESLDDDNNGTIEYEEFVEWIMRGIEKTPQERAEFAERGNLFRLLIAFLDSVTAVARKMLVAPPVDLRPALESIFHDAADETEGHAKAKHLVRMVQRLKREHTEVPISFKIKKKTAKMIIDALDEDKNGTIEQEEFVQWVLKGAQKTRAERRAFAASGDQFRLLTQFLEVIIRFARKINVDQRIESLRPSLMRIFYEASESNDEVGHVDAVNLVQMVAKLRKRYPNIDWLDMEADDKSTANLIIVSLDADGNGTVEVDEWVPWIIKGISKTAVERKKFMEHSEKFAKLMQFADSMGKVAEIMTSEILSLKPALEKLFTDNATDKEHMGPEDILSLADNICKQYPTLAPVTTLQLDADTAKIIVQSLDSDNNGTIELEEWTNWLVAGMKKATVQRAMFAQSGPEFAKLRDFLDAVQSVAEAETGTPGFGSLGKDGVNADSEGDADVGGDAASSDTAKLTTVVPDPQKAIKDRIKKEGVLKKIPALASLQTEHLDAIVDSMEYETYDEDDPLIIEQGTKADRLYVIAAGTVSIMASGKEGWPVERGRKRELEFFGEECLLGIDNQRYSVSGVVTGDDEVQVLKLNTKTNDILTKEAASVVAAAKADRAKQVGTKFAKKFRQKFLARKRRRAGDDEATASGSSTDGKSVVEENDGGGKLENEQMDATDTDMSSVDAVPAKEKNTATEPGATLEEAGPPADGDGKGAGDATLVDDWG